MTDETWCAVATCDGATLERLEVALVLVNHVESLGVAEELDLPASCGPHLVNQLRDRNRAGVGVPVDRPVLEVGVAPDAVLARLLTVVQTLAEPVREEPDTIDLVLDDGYLRLDAVQFGDHVADVGAELAHVHSARIPLALNLRPLLVPDRVGRRLLDLPKDRSVDTYVRPILFRRPAFGAAVLGLDTDGDLVCCVLAMPGQEPIPA